MNRILSFMLVLWVGISLSGCFTGAGNAAYSKAGNLVAKLPMTPKSKALVQAKSDLADVRSQIAKTQKDLNDAEALRIESHQGIMEALGHSTGPALGKDMVEAAPTPYVAEQVQMHRQNQDIAIQEARRCRSRLQQLRSREQQLLQKIQQLESEVPPPSAPTPDGGGGSGGGSGC